MNKLALFISILFYLFIIGCNNNEKKSSVTKDSITGTLNIFHAGSMSVPVKEICDSFNAIHKDVQILTEACGSKQCARNISDLKKDCDVFVSADYKVIEDMLIPNFATWCIPFAGNEMTIVYNPKSKHCNEINKDNWYEILLKKDVIFARSDPNSDPCGVRAVMTIKLAEKFYNKPGLASKMIAKNKNYMRPKETDLLALLESNSIDYIFLYKSVAEQHKLNYLILPNEINLKDPAMSDYYKTVSVELNGKKLGEKVTETGAPMVYGLTIPTEVKNKKAANEFAYYFLTKGNKIIEANGQPSVIPAFTKYYDQIPELFKKFVKKAN